MVSREKAMEIYSRYEIWQHELDVELIKMNWFVSRIVLQKNKDKDSLYYIRTTLPLGEITLLPACAHVVVVFDVKSKKIFPISMNRFLKQTGFQPWPKNPNYLFCSSPKVEVLFHILSSTFNSR